MSVELADREREVAELLGRGFAYVEIATHLGISDRTVEVYVNRASRKIIEAGHPNAGTPARTVRNWAHRAVYGDIPHG